MGWSQKRGVFLQFLEKANQSEKLQPFKEPQITDDWGMIKGNGRSADERSLMILWPLGGLEG